MGITERTTVIRRRRTLAAILAAKYRDPARLLTVQAEDAANENKAAETRVYGCLHSTFDEHDRCVECGAAEVPGPVPSADVVWSWDHTAAMGLAEMTNAAMRRIEEAVQR